MSAAETLLLGLLALGGLLYFGLAGWVARTRHRLDGRVAAVLTAFAVLAGLQEWVRLALWVTLFDARVITPVAHIALVGLALLFLQLNRLFLRAEGQGLGWWLLGAMGLAGVALTGLNLLSWPEPVPLGGLGAMARATLALVTAYAAWGILFTSAALLTFFAYRRTPQPLHRNRIKYWLVVLGLMILGDGLRFGGQELAGGILRVLGAVLLTYVLITHHLPDVRQAVRWAGTSSIVTVLTALFFAAGYGLAAIFLQQLSGNAQWLAGIGLAILLAIALQPFGLFARRVAQRLISGSDYDPGEAVREYGLAISNILSLDRLAVTVVNLTRRTLGSERGVLFLVDESKGEDGHWAFQLQPVAYPGAEAVRSGTLRADHSIAHHLRHDHHPLTQYEIDLARDYQDAAAEERAWLTRLKMDVYVPIYAKEEWIGLLALGPKTSRDRYFDEDLMLLSTLADQTAVGLKNARLVEDLVRLNADLTSAQTSLGRAHHQLQELDKLKSSFLGAITHELRTPFVNLGFSLQLLERQGTEGWAPEQREQLAQLSNGVRAGRQLVDNLIAFSTLLSKQGELKLSQVNFTEIVTGTVAALGFMAQRKGLALEADVKGDLPALEGDQERLAEAVHHLVQNAIKFTEQGKVTVACWATVTTLTVEVKDTGAGVPAERLPELWKSFEQMADPLKRGQEGLGLGLALVKYVVGAHGGEVWAHSTVGVGSTFGFYLPLAPPKPSVEQVVEELKAGGLSSR